MNIHEILSLVKRPARYIGGEKNSFKKPWDKAKARVCCVFPDLYEIGMSHQGLLILYDLINRTKHLLADRCYCPDTDLEKLLRENGLALTGLDTRQPLSAFDILAITLPYELCYTNILTILDLSGIPLFSRDRQEGKWPLILGGGSCCLNPEPVADFFDAILIGDGEEALPEIAQAVMGWREKKDSKTALLKSLSKIEGVYVPQFYKPLYADKNRFLGMETLMNVPKRVKRRILPELSPELEIRRPIVPNIRIVHDRLGVEIARGCTRGCRYCQATTIYRPVREKSISQVIEAAKRGIEATGWEEISLLSLSTGDYSAIGELIPRVMDEFVPRRCSVSLPSLRVGTLTPEIMEEIKRIRKTGITLAPEAGSERLRRIINKGITEEDLLETARQAFERGWKKVKLYFMIGLPGETDQDILELVELVRRVRQQARLAKVKGAVQVTASVGTFVPKPQTPFQWEGQIGTQEARRRLEIIKDGLRQRCFKVKWHEPKQSFLEGVFSRGDRRLSRLIYKAWSMGARLDAWTDHLKVETYLKAADELGIDLGSYLSELPEDAPLYWDHIDSGVKKAFLSLERKRAFRGSYTPDCRSNDCQGCGVCDFKKIKNILKGREGATNRKAAATPAKADRDRDRFFYVVEYEKLFYARFLGHLDMVRMFHRAVRRAGLPVSYSQGFHPMPRISFDNPIPLGMESLKERFEMELTEKVNTHSLIERLQAEMIPGFGIKKVDFFAKKERFVAEPLQSYLIIVPGKKSQEVKESVEKFLASDSFDIAVVRKGKETRLDIKERVKQMGLETSADVAYEWIKKAKTELSSKDTAAISLVVDNSLSPSIKPGEIIEKVLGLEKRQVQLCRILKT